MSSTYSSYKFELIGTGEQAGTWGATTNTNVGTTIEQAIGGYVSVTFTGTTKTLTLTNSNAVQDARALYLDLTGAPGGAAVLEVPAIQKAYIIKNATTGGFTVTAKVTGLTGVNIPNGKTMLVYNNGTDVVLAHDNFSAPVTINVNSTSDALRINQLGTGNALVVEDDTNPDSTPFVINSSGVLISGTTASVNAANAQTGTLQSAGRIQVNGLTTQLATQFQGAWSATAAGAPAVILGKSKGATVGTYTAVASADTLGYMQWQGADGTDFIRAADIRAVVDGTVGTGIVPAYMSFRTADSVGTLNQRMIILASGSVGVGALSTQLTGYNFRISRDITGAVTSYASAVIASVASDVTTTAFGYFSQLSTNASVFTLGDIVHFRASQGTIGVGSTVTQQTGFQAAATLSGATQNYGYISSIVASGTSNWNLYADGTAPNYMGGALGIGSLTLTGYNLRVARTLTGALTSTSIANTGTVASDVTTTAYAYGSSLSTAASVFTLGTLVHYGVVSPTAGAGSTITAQRGFSVPSTMTGATNNYGFYSALDTATGVWGFFGQGTADNAFLGNTRFGAVTAPVATVDVTGSIAATTSILSSGIFSGIGYATGAGAAVTQTTSRTTSPPVINRVTGAITLVSAAGSATYQSFTVTNSAVAATDVIIVNQKSGTDKYIIMVTAVAAGSFQLTFATTGGTTTEQPVFNFAVIKGVAA